LVEGVVFDWRDDGARPRFYTVEKMRPTFKLF
jgi:hypothetical protein